MIAVLLLSFLPNLGSVETVGMTVLLEFGIDKNLGVAAFLTMRVLTMGTIALVCVLILILFHRQVIQMFHRISYPQQGGQPEATKEGDKLETEV